MTETGGNGPWEKYHQAGANAYSEGNYAEAEKQCIAALTEAEKFPPNDPRIAASLNNLGEVYRVLGKYEDAEQYLQRALEVAKRVFGPKHPNVASSLNCLGALYNLQERYAESEQTHKQAMKIRGKALGPEHPDFATDLNNLAEAYRYQGKYTEAEATHKRALLIREKILSPEHSDISQSLNNLSVLYDVQGRYAEAESLSKQAIAIYEKTLGPDHPAVGMSLSNLALVYSNQGKYTEAESLFRRALSILEKALGPEHQNVIIGRQNYADLLKKKNCKAGEREPNNFIDSESKVNFPFQSAIALIYPIGAMISSWDLPIIFLAKLGVGITNLGYLLFFAGIWKGTFLIFGLKKPWQVFFVGFIFFVIGIILTNIYSGPLKPD